MNSSSNVGVSSFGVGSGLALGTVNGNSGGVLAGIGGGTSLRGVGASIINQGAAAPKLQNYKTTPGGGAATTTNAN
jgi:hypothetical protein